MRTRIRVFAAATALLALCGCFQPPQPMRQELDDGLIWMFPGVEGGAWSLEGPYRALRDAGASQAVRIHEWWKPLGSIVNLVSYEQNRADAARIAAQIAAYRQEHPRSAVDLLGYSGGGGVAVMVAESLPEDVRLRHIVLVQPALSPDYDLTTALRHVDGRLFNFYSGNDAWILGAGTTVFGTMDRKYVPSAGKESFQAEKCVSDRVLREKLVQVGWSEEWRAAGHMGFHLGILGYEWNRRFVAPLLAERHSLRENALFTTRSAAGAGAGRQRRSLTRRSAPRTG
ncbi:Alpha/beta hydrolase family protein [Phycisphaerae bacterium RAS1]|nr:Alpha/beta hydrolase family protein [Phycisphaerae bacterium RAS1]